MDYVSLKVTLFLNFIKHNEALLVYRQKYPLLPRTAFVLQCEGKVLLRHLQDLLDDEMGVVIGGDEKTEFPLDHLGKAAKGF